MDFASIQRSAEDGPSATDHFSTTNNNNAAISSNSRLIGSGTTSKGKGQRSNAERERKEARDCCRLLTGVTVFAFVFSAAWVYLTIDLSDHTHNGYNLYDQVLASRESDDYSSVLCDVYTVSVSSLLRASMFLTQEPVSPRPDARWVFPLSAHLHHDHSFAFRAFFLLPGSVVEASACLTSPVKNASSRAQLLFFRGRDGFNLWKRDPACQHCVTRHDIIDPDALCSAQKFINVTYDVGSDAGNHYYVVIARQLSYDVTLPFEADLFLTVNKTAYNVSRAERQCLHNVSCTLSLPFNAPGDVIVQFDDVAGEDNFFSTDCHKRISFALLIFLALPLGILLVVVGVYCGAGRVRRHHNSDAEGERRGTNNSDDVTRYGTTTNDTTTTTNDTTTTTNTTTTRRQIPSVVCQPSTDSDDDEDDLIIKEITHPPASV